jgi:hypothetical protein
LLQNTILPESEFELDKVDYLPEWLPFFGHPIYEKQRHLEPKILSVAWLIYNQVTIDIENDVVIPLCLSWRAALVNPEPLNTLLTQAMIDEAYHILLTNHAVSITREKRQLHAFQLPKSGFVQAMQNCQNQHESLRQKQLILLATGVITEVFIGAYLALIANCKDNTLQPLNILVTKAHMLDESVHGFVFATLAQELIHTFSEEEKQFFKDMLLQVVLWYFGNKTTAWYEVLPQLGFVDSHVMLQDCKKDAQSIFAEEPWVKIESLVNSLGYFDFRDNLLQKAQQDVQFKSFTH